jgi:hypothetical protein
MTNENGGLIPPNHPKDIQDTLNDLSKVLDTTVEYGAYMLNLLLNTKGAGDTMLQPIMLFRQFIELVDSISVSVKASSIDPCKISLRVLIETSLSLEYMIDKDFEQRSSAYVVATAIRNKKAVEKFIDGSEASKQFKAALKKDKMLGSENINLSQWQTTAEKELEAIEGVLRLPSNKLAYEEYQSIKTRTGKDPAWYSLFGGPNSIEQLATQLQRIFMYEVLYRYFSGSVHSVDITKRKIVSGNDGKAYVLAIRDIQDAQQTVVHTINTTLQMYNTVATKLLTRDDVKNVSQWYIDNIQQALMELSGEPIFIFK